MNFVQKMKVFFISGDSDEFSNNTKILDDENRNIESILNFSLSSIPSGMILKSLIGLLLCCTPKHLFS